MSNAANQQLAGDGCLHPLVRDYDWNPMNRCSGCGRWEDEIRAAEIAGLKLVPPDHMVSGDGYYVACPDGFRKWKGPGGRIASQYGYPIYFPND